MRMLVGYITFTFIFVFILLNQLLEVNKQHEDWVQNQFICLIAVILLIHGIFGQLSNHRRYKNLQELIKEERK